MHVCAPTSLHTRWCQSDPPALRRPTRSPTSRPCIAHVNERDQSRQEDRRDKDRRDEDRRDEDTQDSRFVMLEIRKTQYMHAKKSLRDNIVQHTEPDVEAFSFFRKLCQFGFDHQRQRCFHVHPDCRTQILLTR